MLKAERNTDKTDNQKQVSTDELIACMRSNLSLKTTKVSEKGNANKTHFKVTVKQ